MNLNNVQDMLPLTGPTFSLMKTLRNSSVFFWFLMCYVVWNSPTLFSGTIGFALGAFFMYLYFVDSLAFVIRIVRELFGTIDPIEIANAVSHFVQTLTPRTTNPWTMAPPMHRCNPESHGIFTGNGSPFRRSGCINPDGPITFSGVGTPVNYTSDANIPQTIPTGCSCPRGYFCESMNPDFIVACPRGGTYAPDLSCSSANNTGPSMNDIFRILGIVVSDDCPGSTETSTSATTATTTENDEIPPLVDDATPATPTGNEEVTIESDNESLRSSVAGSDAEDDDVDETLRQAGVQGSSTL